MTILLIVVGMLISTGGCNNSKPHIILGGGYGGPTDSANLSIEGIQTTQNWQGRDTLTGVGFTMIFNGEGVPSEAVSTSGSWSNWYQYEAQNGYLIDEGTKRYLPEMGLFGKYGIEIVKNTGLFATAFGGVTFADEVHLWTSRLGPPDYYETEGWITYGMLGGGISYYLNNDVYLQVDYDNRRGTTVGFGWKF